VKGHRVSGTKGGEKEKNGNEQLDGVESSGDDSGADRNALDTLTSVVLYSEN
jgi:hypothetical protein